MKKMFFYLLFFVTVSANAAGSNARAQFQDGDLILQTSTSRQSRAIQLATHSKYSHVGMIVYRSGKPYVYEARGPVGYRTLSAFISTGLGGKYVVRRIKNGLTAAQVTKIKAAAVPFAGKPYDKYFEWANNRIYCSELVWKIYQNALGVSIGKLEQLKDFDLSHPEVQEIMEERYGDDIPYEETVIAPSAIHVSPNLVTIYQN